jgi:hypothetical protein
MTDTERQLMILKCGQLLQDVLVEIRNLTCQDGHAKRVNDLADLTHNIPQFMVGRDEYVIGYIRQGFLDYARTYHPEIDPETHRYVRLLDMDADEFNNGYRRETGLLWPAPTVPVAIAG